MNEHIAEEYEHNGMKIKIHYDLDPIDPRGHDHLGKMICFHKRYNLGDKHDTKKPESWRKLEERLLKKSEEVIIHDLYLLDHSGLSMSTSPYQSSWDSGKVGFIYTTKERILKRYQADEITDELLEKARRVLKAEVEEYNQYLRGDVYGFEIIDEHECSECGISHSHTIDQVYGYYSIEHAKEEAESIAAMETSS